MPFSRYDFRTLSVEEQLKALWAEGTFLAARWEQQDRVYLYHMGTFFTELYCDLEKNAKISTRTFTSREHLEDYVACVKLDDLPL